jgi:hypothetical protein
MNLSPYALTTLANVKSRLGIQNTSSDTQLTATINAATDFIERECGKSGPERYPNDGHFIQKTYTNEVYTVRGSKQIYLPLRNAPVLYLIVTGNLTANSAVVTNVTPSNGIAAGMPLYAIDGLFPQDTVVASVSGTSVTMSAPASISATAAVFEISGLISFQWRPGVPDAPNWTSFFPPQFELDQQGYSGIVRVYGPIPRIYNTMVRATYVAGYAVDWPNQGNGSTHLLPSDLTNLCENLVVRIFKRFPIDGKASENIQGATVTWRDKLDALDLNVINNYKRVGMVF